MKNLMVFVLMLASQVGFAAEQNNFNPEILSAKLTGFSIDPNHTRLAGVSYGEVVVDLGERKITANLYRPHPCKEGMACPAVMVPVTIELPIVSIYNDRCGSQVYVAKEDHRPVDGILEQLTVSDHSFNRCKHLRLPASATVFETAGYNRLEGVEFHNVSTFTGGRLLAADVDPREI